MLDSFSTFKKVWPEYFEAETITLDNGTKIIKRYGKYDPLLCFFLKEDNLHVHWYDMKTFNIPFNLEFDARRVEWIPGHFWVSKKGTRCFRPDDEGDHILIASYWGGCFESSRGDEFTETKALEECLHYRRASSNGGGCGTNYYVFPKDYHRELTEDDI